MKKIVVAFVMILSTVVYAKGVPIGKVMEELYRFAAVISFDASKCVYWNEPTETPSMHDLFVKLLGTYPDTAMREQCIETVARIDVFCGHPSVNQ